MPIGGAYQVGTRLVSRTACWDCCQQPASDRKLCEKGFQEVYSHSFFCQPQMPHMCCTQLSFQLICCRSGSRRTCSTSLCSAACRKFSTCSKFSVAVVYSQSPVSLGQTLCHQTLDSKHPIVLDPKAARTLTACFKPFVNHQNRTHVYR